MLEVLGWWLAGKCPQCGMTKVISSHTTHHLHCPYVLHTNSVLVALWRRWRE